jgi:hypothetical protein
MQGITFFLLFGWAKSKQKAHHENHPDFNRDHNFRGHQPHKGQQYFEMFAEI